MFGDALKSKFEFIANGVISVGNRVVKKDVLKEINEWIIEKPVTKSNYIISIAEMRKLRDIIETDK
jgi:hypothetical protein